MSHRLGYFAGVALAAGLLLSPWLLGGSDAAVRAQDTTRLPAYLPLLVRGFTGPFPLPLAAPTHTSTPRPSATPTATPPEPTPTEEPTEVPSVTPTPPPTVTSTPEVPAWLLYVNHHRSLAALPKLTENEAWSRGDQLHAKYMVKNDFVGHTETVGKPAYSAEGNEAAKNGNVAGHNRARLQPQVPIDMWMTGPFHMLGILDPLLTTTGFGDYTESDGGIQYGATLDVLRGRAEKPPASVKYPVRYPEQGAILPNLSYNGDENPDPLTSCATYKAPTGPPIAIQFGPGDTPPKITKTSFRNEAGVELAHCWYDEKKFNNDLGKSLLKFHSAMILFPKDPLKAGARYSVSVTHNNKPIEWTFRTAEDAPSPLGSP